MSIKADFVVVGSGLSGLNSVLAISRHIPEATIVVIEPSLDNKGASSAPMALLNPSTSRSPNIIEDAECLISDAYNCYSQFLDENNKPILSKKGIFKAVPLGEDPIKWQKKYENSNWPNGWSEWINSGDVETKLGMNRNAAPHGGILIHESWVVQMDQLRASMIKKCKSLTSHFIIGPIQKHDIDDKSIVSDNLLINYDNLLYANGFNVFTNIYFNDWLTAHPIKGQMLSFTTSALPELDKAITNSGYFGQLSNQKYAVGSTYEHHFLNIEPDLEGKTRLLNKLNHLLGYELSEDEISEITPWSAVRVASKDRKPLIGRHPSIDHLYLINGMASKGLIYSPTAANRLIKYILGDLNALKNWDLQRYL
jgi:glycine/D-amino acid oxidase-like deaminating enzyme